MSHLDPAFYCVDGTGSLTFVSRSATELTGLGPGMVLDDPAASDSLALESARAEVLAVLTTDHTGGRMVVLRAHPDNVDAGALASAPGASPTQSPNGALAPWLAHEMRTPLACILGAVELLVDSLGDRIDAEEQLLIESLLRNGDRLAQRIEEAIMLGMER